MTPLHPRRLTQQRRGFLQALAGLSALGLLSRHTGSLYGAQVEAPSKPLRLIKAIARPELAKAVTIHAPPQNCQRSISVWVEIDAAAMREDFMQTTERWLAGGR